MSSMRAGAAGGTTYPDGDREGAGADASAAESLGRFGLGLLPSDRPGEWTARLRTGLATLATEAAGPASGLAVLRELFPSGPEGVGLSERDVWARLLLQAGDVAGSLAMARARKAERDSFLPRTVIVDALIVAGDFEAARSEAEGIEALSGAGSVALLNALASVTVAEGDAAAAAALYRQALAVRPDNLPALRGLADALALGGDLEAAAGVLQDAAGLSRAEARPAVERRLGELRDMAGLPVPGGTEGGVEAALEVLAARLREELTRMRQAPRAARPAEARAPASAPREPVSAPRGQPRHGASMLARAEFEPDEVAPEELSRVLFDHFGHGAFRPGQAAVLRSVLAEGRDTLALMPTGAGKSLCFQLPALVLPGVVLVVSPLVALMADQLAGLAEVAGLAGRATLINSSLSAEELDARLDGLANGAYSLVYAAPERLRQAGMQWALRRAGVSLLVIDEAHCLCLWGHAFRPDYLAVGALLSALQVPRVLAVTATATPEMQEEIARTLGRQMTVVNTGVLRDNLFLEVRHLASVAEKRTAMLEFVRGARGQGIVYATSRADCEALAAVLRRWGVAAAHYHAGIPSGAREDTQRSFMAGTIRVLVATVAFGMGVNKRDVRFIVHYHPARSLEAYTQEAGRAGRDGQPAHCLLLATPSDKGTLTRRAREDSLGKDALRELYGRVRRAVRGAGNDPLDMEVLLPPSADRADGDTALRVGLSALERSGFLERGLDSPMQVSLLLHDAGDLRAAALHGLPGLRDGRGASIGIGALAEATGLPVDGVEGALVELHQAGLLDYRAGRRGMVLRLVEPPPADGSQRLEAVLQAYEGAALARARAMVDYIEATKCRNATIARHFGEAAPAACGRCDICRPAAKRSQAAAPKPQVRRETSMEPRQAILGLMAEMPFRAGRTTLARILAGAASSPIGPDRARHHGVLGAMTQAAIVAMVDALIEDGLLESVHGDKFTLVALSERGRAALYE